jgi:hypothetical protein
VEPPVEGEVSNLAALPERLHVVPYRAILDVSEHLVRRVARLLNQERQRRGTRRGTRALSCRRQAILVLRWFRERADAAALARDNGIGRATAYRYIDEAITVLADHAPSLEQALRRARENGGRVILDGKLFPADRCGQRDPVTGNDVWYHGRKRRHGGNVQFLAGATGEPLWTSPVEPGSVADITAARRHVLPQLRSATGEDLVALADAGYDGAGAGIHVPIKRPRAVPEARFSLDNQAYNLLQRGMRGIGERAMAVLTGRWRVLRHTTKSPSRIGDIVQAALTLTILEQETC